MARLPLSARKTCALAALALTLAAPAAQAITINGDTLTGPGNGDNIQIAAPGFGSDGPVLLNYDVAGSDPLLYWNGAYSGSSAAYCLSGINCALEISVSAGSEVTLVDFSLGGWPNTNRNIDWSVVNLFDGSTIASASAAFVSGTTGLLNTINATSSAGFQIFFGPDGWSGGLTSVNFTFSDASTPTPIPLPAAGWLMLAGLGGLAAMRRRKRV